MIGKIKKFKEWVAESCEHAKITRIWLKHYKIKRSIEFIEQYDAEKSWNKLNSRIRKRRNAYNVLVVSAAVAASLVLLVVFTEVLSDKSENLQELATKSPAEIFPETGGKKATLTLHTGEVIDLTSLNEHVLVEKEDTLLFFDPNESITYKQVNEISTEEVKYNTLTIPRGGEYKLVLSDGTKVWLNAESSLHYPVAFAKVRDVILTGEAYFEVAPNSKSFIIHMNANRDIEVLGTKFNVSAYGGNQIITTVTEGKVKLSNAVSSVVLKPNQQGVVNETDEIYTKFVDAQLFMSWSQGVYQFQKTELKEIIAQLSRWYDVDISFKNEHLKQKLFTGVIYRDNKLGFAVETIEKISNVKFNMEGEKIYIDN